MPLRIDQSLPTALSATILCLIERVCVQLGETQALGMCTMYSELV